MLTRVDELEPPPVEPPGDDGDEGPDDSGPWATLATFWNSSEAQIARLRLESDDIPCVIFDENLVATNWLWATAVGGIKLMVPESRLGDAREALRRTTIEHMKQADGEPLYDGLERCPRCGSDDMYIEKISKRVAMLSLLLLGVPIPFIRRTRRCAACGASWRAAHTC